MEGSHVTELLGTATLPRLLAVEVLLAEPEALQDDVLESCLYILRERLRGTTGSRDVLTTCAGATGRMQDNRRSES